MDKTENVAMDPWPYLERQEKKLSRSCV